MVSKKSDDQLTDFNINFYWICLVGAGSTDSDGDSPGKIPLSDFISNSNHIIR